MPGFARASAWPHIDPGKKRHQIQIQAPVASENNMGAPTWPPFYTCWAAIETKAMREVFQEGFVSQVVHVICIDWPGRRVVINASQRVVVLSSGSVYLIQAVDNVEERNLVLRLQCIQIDGAAVPVTI
jgi:head-tail adaptor